MIHKIYLLLILLFGLLSCKTNSESSASKQGTEKQDFVSLTFARGSSYQGLNVIEIYSQGKVVLWKKIYETKTFKVLRDFNKVDELSYLVSRGAKLEYTEDGYVEIQVENYWAKSKIILNGNTVDQILGLIDKFNLINLNRKYSNDSIKDGTQWAFWLQKEEGSKLIYFNNEFPEEIKKFAKSLDETLDKSGLVEAQWEDVIPGKNERNHEKAIWRALQEAQL
ncbi:MAG: hypothetical protein NE327_18620 [Lentisphaeraceae bacterium]|nr:hypothetical protein [Lentisphaeraceae bacterium]